MKHILFKINIVIALLIIIIANSLFVSAKSAQNSDACDVFSDIQKDTWYYDGVQTVYKNGIMNGISSDTFAPDGTVTWVQAIKIASEIRSLYTQDKIEECDGPWYEKYVKYMVQNSILPSEYSSDSPDMEINRSNIANLFYLSVPKEKLVEAGYCNLDDVENDSNKEAIQKLCNAGILTGKGENLFDPDGKATRAEISVIIDRILNPVNRVITDEKQNANMKNNLTLFDNGGLAVETDNCSFYIYCTQTPAEKTYEIIAYRNKDDISTIYTTQDSIGKLSVGPDNRLYFTQGQYIKSITQDGKAEKIEYIGVYNVNNPISYYTFYDGDLYVMECYQAGATIDEFLWRITSANNNGTSTLVRNITNNMLGDDVLYLFNGYLYKVSANEQKYNISKIDLKTGAETTIIKNIYRGDAAFVGANVWYTNLTDKGIELIISPLHMPEEKFVVGTFEQLTPNYSTMTAASDSAYFQVSSSMKIWQITKRGELKEIATTNNANIEKCTITRHGIILNAKENITQLSHNSMNVVAADSERITYGELLNKISSRIGSYTPIQGDNIRVPEPKTGENGKINISVTRDIKKENGDSVLELSISNLTGKDARINSFDLILSGEKEKIETRFMLSMEIGNGQDKAFTIFIPKEEIDKLNGKFRLGWNFNAQLKR